MDAAGNQDDRFAASDQGPRFTIGERGVCWRTDKSRVGELSLNLFEFIQALQILGRADRGIDKRRAHGRLANLFEVHAIAG